MKNVDLILKYIVLGITTICWFPIFLLVGIISGLIAHFDWFMKTWRFVIDPIIEYEGEENEEAE